MLSDDELRTRICLEFVSEESRDKILRLVRLAQQTESGYPGRLVLGSFGIRVPKTAADVLLRREPDVIVRFGTLLVILEMQDRAGKLWMELEYQRALVASVFAHLEREVEAEKLASELQSGVQRGAPKVSSQEEINLLNSRSITHVEHILFLTPKVNSESNPLFKEKADGKDYIAEYRTEGNFGSQPSAIMTVYRIVSLSRAPEHDYETTDSKDLWASILRCDKGATKIWPNVPSSFFNRRGVGPLTQILGFRLLQGTETMPFYTADMVERDLVQSREDGILSADAKYKPIVRSLQVALCKERCEREAEIRELKNQLAVQQNQLAVQQHQLAVQKRKSDDLQLKHDAFRGVVVEVMRSGADEFKRSRERSPNSASRHPSHVLSLLEREDAEPLSEPGKDEQTQ